MATAMSQITSRLSLYFGRMDVQKQRHHLRAAGSELHRLARPRLGQTPYLRIIQRPVLDLVHHVRPAPARVDFVEQRSGRIVQPGRGGLFRLQMIAFESGPALQRIVMPGAAGQVLVDVEIGMIQNIQAGALLIADHNRQRILELLAEANIQHAGVERASPHADIEPARTGKRAGHGSAEESGRRLR